MAVIEIQTIEGGRLEWVGIYSSSDADSAIEWGDRLLAGFHRGDLKPHIRILDRPYGKVTGAWQKEGFTETEAE